MSQKSKFNNLYDLLQKFPDEQTCRAYYAQIRWKEGKPTCPHCKFEGKIYQYKDGKLYKCSECKKQFTVTVGTVFEKTHLPLKKWFVATYLISSHKKGISSHQLARDLSVTQETAWFLLHRIRNSMKKGNDFNGILSNIVEVDETYIGGAEKNKHLSKRTKGTQGRSVKTKTPVFGMLERNGMLISQPVDKTDRETIQAIINQRVSKESVVISDEWLAYNGLGKDYNHQVINHGRSEYVREKLIHTNTLEGFWSLFKRGIVGIYHWLSDKHLFRYCEEFQFRYNTRKETEINRFNLVLSLFNGHKMQMKQLTAQV